jgi:hypothetical protein
MVASLSVILYLPAASDDFANVTNLDREGYKWYFHTPFGFTSLVWTEATKVILGEKKSEDMKEPEREDLETTRKKCSDAFIAENENPSTGGTVRLQVWPFSHYVIVRW